MNEVADRKSELSDRRMIGLTACNTLKVRFPGRSVDVLLTYPDDAKAVCVEVRRRLGRRVEDHQILQALINERCCGNAAVRGRKR